MLGPDRSSEAERTNSDRNSLNNLPLVGPPRNVVISNRLRPYYATKATSDHQARTNLVLGSKKGGRNKRWAAWAISG
eukprot:scaffold4570_cov81-Cylindrotheca_fusiformis.AAC.4